MHLTRIPRVAGMVGVACAAALVARAVGAQRTRTTPRATPIGASCEGLRISSIEIDPGRPGFAGSARTWRAAAHALGLHHATTQAGVIRSYIALAEGDVCTDTRRAESERILRTLPFLADASVRAFPDGAGGVRIRVTTVDEIPVLVSGAVRYGQPAALSLGSANVGGLGLRAIVGVQRGFAYRNGVHTDVVEYGAFNRPLVASLDASQDPLGGHIELGFSHPFYTDLQHAAWQSSFRTADDFVGLHRPEGDNVALEVRQERWSVGGVLRTRIGGLVGLLGGVALGTRITPATAAVVVARSGLEPDQDTVLRGRYSTYRTTRLGALVGVRRVSYVTVSGFDALFAAQDLTRGVQVGTLFAPGLGLRGYRDALVAGSIYAGNGNERSFLAGEFESEASRELSGNSWGSMIGSGRLAWYRKLSPTMLFTAIDELSVANRGRVPTQLTFSDAMGGVRGYGASQLAGARRNVTRAEMRWAHPALIRGSDIGLAVFSDFGILRAGDVPYGSNTIGHSAGVSILGAYPTQSKRLYRLDFAFATGPNSGRGFEVRFRSNDPTVAFWTEPGDVTRSRLAPVPSSLFAWPTR